MTLLLVVGLFLLRFPPLEFIAGFLIATGILLFVIIVVFCRHTIRRWAGEILGE